MNACDGKAIERGAIIHSNCPDKVQDLQNRINISILIKSLFCCLNLHMDYRSIPDLEQSV